VRGSATKPTPSTIELVVNHVEGTWMNRLLTGVEYEAAAAGLDVVITLARENYDWTSRVLRRRSAGAVGRNPAT
jgi:hypothetical protein